MAAVGRVAAKAAYEFGGSCRRKAFRVHNREALARLERMDPRHSKGWLAFRGSCRGCDRERQRRISPAYDSAENACRT